MEAFRYLLANLPLISCIGIIALAAAGLAIVRRASRARRVDTSDWIPARGTVVERREHNRDAGLEVSLVVSFSTLDGRRVEFADELAAWQIGYAATVPVIYDPADPHRARVIRRRRGRA